MSEEKQSWYNALNTCMVTKQTLKGCKSVVMHVKNVPAIIMFQPSGCVFSQYNWPGGVWIFMAASQ